MIMKEKWVDAVKVKLIFRGSSYVNLIKNPTPSEFKELVTSQLFGIRGVVLPSGDFFSASLMDSDDHLEIIHDELISIVPGIEDYSGWETEDYFLEEFLCVISESPDFLTFHPAASYSGGVSERIKELYLKDYANALRRKNSTMKLRM